MGAGVAEDLFINGLRQGFSEDWNMAFITNFKMLVDINLRKNIRQVKQYSLNQDPSELLNKCTLMMKNNINVVHGYARVWSRYVRECISMVRTIAREVGDKTL